MTMHVSRRAALLLPMPALAQGIWAPDRPVRIIVPFAAGGPTDILARLVQSALAEGLGQPVVIENRPGAGGNIGIQAVQRSAPDGLTLLFTSSAFAANPALTRPAPYDALRDFAPISNVAASPNAIVATPRAGIGSLAEMLAQARARPGGLEYSSPGNGTGPHITAELFRLRAAIDMLHVPFNGGAPAVQAALAGTVALSFSAMPAAAPHIRSGALRGLAVTGAERWPDFPDLPTVQEQGFPGFVAETWQAMFAPAGTPPAALARISAIVRDTIQGLPPGRLRGIGFYAVVSTPEEFAAQLAREVPELAAGIAAANIRAD
jgi:tripartite-type tricarboxylate transporter receptor subunit TctC